jgi:hypothetical protein
MVAGKLGTEFKGTFRDGDVTPEPCLMIRLEFLFDSARVGCRDLPAEDLLGNSIGPLRRMERGKQDVWLSTQQLIGSARMGVFDLDRDQEAAVNVNRQSRCRSLKKSSTAVRTRSPKIAFRRASKSGHSTFRSVGCSGTIFAISLSRSRNSTVLPARSHAFKRRVSRSWRMLTEGISQCDTLCVTLSRWPSKTSPCEPPCPPCPPCSIPKSRIHLESGSPFADLLPSPQWPR